MKRAVIVGCGNIAAVHAAVLTAQKDTELVGVADIHFEKAQDYAERFHTKPYASPLRLYPFEGPFPVRRVPENDGAILPNPKRRRRSFSVERRGRTRPTAL